MKMPIVCPCCHEPLLNEFNKKRNGIEYITKNCLRKLDHKFTCLTYRNDGYADYAGVELYSKDMIRVNWDFIRQTIFISKGPEYTVTSTRDLPYFEPDFSDYGKLIAKLKTYVTFS